MNLEGVVGRAWRKTRENFVRKRYLAPGNYLSDVVAGNISRTPLYAVVDNVLVGATEGQVVDSALNSLKVSLCGWSLSYIMGNSILAEALGPFYERNKKSVDAAYSAVMTFGFGMGVNLAAGYTTKQALIASGLRAALAVPLGPVTRFYSDAMREARGEPSITPNGSSFRGKRAAYSIPRMVAMIALPLAIMYGALAYSKNQSSDLTQNKSVVEVVSSRQLLQ